MKRTLKYALTMVLGAAIVVPAMAQSNFPDVPETHWAYKELARLKADGLLVGYPDGLYRGGRPASRYEMAVALHALYMRLKGVTDGLKGQIDDILAKLETKADKADVDNLRAAFEALKAQVGNLTPADVAAIKRLVDEFGAELKALGADVAKMKQDLNDLSDRVTGLEKALPVSISGDANLLALAGYGTGHRNGITVDGRPTGNRSTIFGNQQDITIFHEAAVTLKNRVKSNVNWDATLVFGNMLGEGNRKTTNATSFGDQDDVIPGAFFTQGRDSVYVQSFGVQFAGNVLGLPVNTNLGRIGYQVSPYIFKRPDNTPYYSNERWDNGNWMVDGAVVKLAFGPTFSLDLIGGQVNTQTDSAGNPIQTLTAGSAGHAVIPGTTSRPYGNVSNGLLSVNNVLGANVKVGLGAGGLNLAYLVLDGDKRQVVANQVANRVDVWGGEVNVPFGRLSLDAGYAQSDVRYDDKNVITKDNSAWYGDVGFKMDTVSLKVGYKQILPQFAAPGDWGRIGIWYNPTDIMGFNGALAWQVSPSLLVNAGAAFYTGTDETIFGSKGLTKDDKINHYVFDLGYKFNPSFGVSLGWERADWKLNGLGKPTEQWFNIGTNWALNDKAQLNFLWQISDYNGKNIAGWGPFGGSAATKATGGLITTQFSLKF